jgi:hypothetical protein
LSGKSEFRTSCPFSNFARSVKKAPPVIEAGQKHPEPKHTPIAFARKESLPCPSRGLPCPSQIFRSTPSWPPPNRSIPISVPTFLEMVAANLSGREIGDGLVARVCAEAQARFFTPPDLSHARGTPQPLRRVSR